MILSGPRREYVLLSVCMHDHDLTDSHYSVANFAAYTFAPPILVTPLGALSVIIGCVSCCTGLLSPRFIIIHRAILASFLLNEELGHLGRVGCTLCLLGSLIIVLHAPEDKPIETVDEILHYAVQPGTSNVSIYV